VRYAIVAISKEEKKKEKIRKENSMMISFMKCRLPQPHATGKAEEQFMIHNELPFL
jgi:hypothetical protein